MRRTISKIMMAVIAASAISGSAFASGSYSSGGFTPPKTKKETKPAETSKPKKKKTSQLGVHGAFGTES